MVGTPPLDGPGRPAPRPGESATAPQSPDRSDDAARLAALLRRDPREGRSGDVPACDPETRGDADAGGPNAARPDTPFPRRDAGAAGAQASDDRHPGGPGPRPGSQRGDGRQWDAPSDTTRAPGPPTPDPAATMTDLMMSGPAIPSHPRQAGPFPAGPDPRRAAAAEPSSPGGAVPPFPEQAAGTPGPGRLEARMQRDPHGGRHGGSGDEGDADRGGSGPVPPAEPASFRGDAILAGLLGAGAAAPAVASAPSRAAELASLVDQLAGRVLVGRRADGETEIRVTLGPVDAAGQPGDPARRGGMLDGTEVRIALHQGSLEIRIEPRTAAAGDVLRAEAAGLSRTLAERLGQPVVVELAPLAAGAAAGGQSGGQPGVQLGGQAGGDARQRSRGYEDILRYAAGQDR